MTDSHLVFVYGSLQRGERNHGYLGTAHDRGEARSEPRFRLYALPEYPVLVRDDQQPRAIVGELYSIDDATLEQLDRLEDNGRLYRRELIRVESLESPHAPRLAWTYLFLGDVRVANPWPADRWSGSQYQGGRLDQLRIPPPQK